MYLKILHALRRSAGVSVMLATTSAWAISPEALRVRLEKGDNVLVIDLRPAVAYESGHIPGALNIPISLLPMKPLPANAEVVVYGDGLGLVDDVKAAAAIRAKPGVRGEVLSGGYAAWLESTRLTTAPVGVERERLPGITYNQLLAANRSDMVLVDLRGVGPTAAAASEDNAGGPRRAQQTNAASSGDLVAGFATKLGVRLVTATGGNTEGRTVSQSDDASGPARAAAPAGGPVGSGQLLVLVADNDTAANEAARQLRASGQYRFTILIGGTESIRHEGRVGSARMDSDLVVPKNSGTR